jgi:hypothetical protein
MPQPLSKTKEDDGTLYTRPSAIENAIDICSRRKMRDVDCISLADVLLICHADPSNQFADTRQQRLFDASVGRLNRYFGCVYRKLKLGRSGDEVRPRWSVT